MKRFTLTMKSLLLLFALTIALPGWSWTTDLTASYEVAGYKTKAFYNFLSDASAQALIPAEGDFRFRDNNNGWFNFGSGNRAGVASIAVAATDMIVIDVKDTQTRGSLVNSVAGCTENTLLKTGTYQFFEANSNQTSLNVNVGRAGAVVAILVLEKDASAKTANYTVNYVDQEGVAVKDPQELEGIVGEHPTVSKENAWKDGVKYMYVSDDANDIEIAESGTVVTVKFRMAETYSYSVAASTGRVYATGSNYEGETITVPYYQYIVANHVLLEAQHGSSNYYNRIFTLTKNNQEEVIDYNIIVGGGPVYYYAEGEDIEGMTACETGNANVRCSMAKGGFAESDVKIITLPAGKYKIATQVWGGTGVTFNILAGEEVVASNSTTGSLVQKMSEEFTLTSATDITIAAAGNGGSSAKLLDWIYIIKTDGIDDDAPEEETVKIADLGSPEWLLNDRTDLADMGSVVGPDLKSLLEDGLIIMFPETFKEFSKEENYIKYEIKFSANDNTNESLEGRISAVDGCIEIPASMFKTDVEYSINIPEGGVQILTRSASGDIDSLLATTAHDYTLNIYTDDTATPKPAQLVDGKDYYLYNIEADKFLGAGNSWGTQGSFIEHGQRFTAKDLGNGKWALDSHVSNGGESHYLGANGYVDGAAAQLNIYQYGSVCAMTVDGTNYFGYDSQTPNVLSTTAATSYKDAAAQWKFFTKEDLQKTFLTLPGDIEDAADATFLLKDPNFSRNNSDKGAWQVSSDCTNKNLAGGANENMCAESYHSTFTITQTAEVPNGTYLVKAQGFYRNDGENPSIPCFIANTKTSNFPLKTGSENSMADASASFTAGLYTCEPMVVKVTDGTLTIGVRNLDYTSLWCIWDNFEIECIEVEAESANLLKVPSIGAIATNNIVSAGATITDESYAEIVAEGLGLSFSDAKLNEGSVIAVEGTIVCDGVPASFHSAFEAPKGSHIIYPFEKGHTYQIIIPIGGARLALHSCAVDAPHRPTSHCESTVLATNKQVYTFKFTTPAAPTSIDDLKNLNFDEGTMIDNGVCTYAKDCGANNTTYSQMQPVKGWALGVENGDARAAALYAWGSPAFLGGAGYVIPATDALGNTEGGALGIVGVWTGTVQYVQEVELPADRYDITFHVYNAGGTGEIVENLCGFIAGGKKYCATEKTFPVGEWTTLHATFTLKEATAGKLSVGYVAADAGSGSMPHLFIDKVSMTGETVGMAGNNTGADATVIAGIESLNGEVPVAYYSASGARLSAPVKGINIVKMADNTVKKIYVK